jgi:DNA mismatch repair protein MutL
MHPQLQTSTLGRRISILPPLVAERIAAGEVIERPASVVKELVENSIDAGATQIEVRLQKGGCDMIEVLDNGSGMSREDLELCVCRHATSKIHQLEDLNTLESLGFRGEALPSIASVAELQIVSRSHDHDETHEIRAAHTTSERANASRVANYNFLGSNHGTRIRVLSLFSQIPARMKFLKSSGAETNAVREIIERLALTHPEVRFAVYSEERCLLDLPSETLSKRAERMLSDGNPFELLETKLEGAWGIQIIWLKGLSSPHSRSIYQIVNGRALRDRILQHALLNPLRQSFLPGHFPSIVVKLDIPADEIDVNVHPTKTEVRFLDTKKIYALCSAAFERILKESIPTFETRVSTQEYGYSPGYSLGYSSSYSSNFSSRSASESTSRGYQPSFETLNEIRSEGSHIANQLENQPGNQPRNHLENQQANFDTSPFGQFRGILFSTYFVFEQGEELLLIDQHAAHERIRYERLKNSVLNREVIPQQELLVPEIIKIARHDLLEIKDRLSLLNQLGFDAEAFSEDSVVFRSLPSVWGSNQLSTRLKNLLTRLQESASGHTSDENLVWDEVLFEKIAMEACRSSFKAGDHIHEAGAIDLTRKLMTCAHPGNCPHGRPTMIRIHQNKVEEWFSRKI